MGQSKRIDRPRCPKCRKKDGTVRHPIAIAVNITGHNEYVTLKCVNCNHAWKSKGEGAYRLAVSSGLASYGK